MGRGYLEALAGVSRAGAFARAEAGAHLTPALAAFAYGQVDTQAGPHAGAGVRWRF